jgi:hypothetical protein
MEGLTRIVSESLARHGFDRPLDYRRLSWSRWFRCESHHSLLFVPSKPGVFALAEEITDLGSANVHVGTDAFTRPATEASAPVEERRLSAASRALSIAALAAGAISPDAQDQKADAPAPRRMLAVTQFFEDDDMAFVLDRMLSRQNPMAARLASGRYFARYVVIEDQTQRRSICNALNQWMVSAAEKATGIGSHFATSLELTPATEYVPPVDDRQQTLFGTNHENVGRTLPSASSGQALSATADAIDTHVATAAKPAPSGVEGAVPRSEASGLVEERRFSAASSAPQEPAASAAQGRRLPGPTISPTPTSPQLDSGAATNIHCPSPFPSGF